MGAGVAGTSAAVALDHLGAEVQVTDNSDTVKTPTELSSAGLFVQAGVDGWVGTPPELIVVSPGVAPNSNVIRNAIEMGIPIWSELELAWQLRKPGASPEWLVISGTNGKTTTTLMTSAMGSTEGKTAWAVGNIGSSIVEAVTRPEQPDYYVVEAAAAQMVFTESVRPLASVVLNFAPDHLDYFGSIDSYARNKGKVYVGTQQVAIFNTGDPATERMVNEANLSAKVLKVGIRMGEPQRGEFGLQDGFLVDNVFSPSLTRLAATDDVQPHAQHNVFNALAAAALIRSAGYSPESVRIGLESFVPAKHRITEVAEIDGVRYIDDSKATNAHAAATSIVSYPKVVWIAGGLAKGQEFSGLVQQVREHLRAVVLMGRDRSEISAALTRHAPSVPQVEIACTEPDAMHEAVRAARGVAQSGDVVLLAPACASWDIFRDYQHRGDIFAAEVFKLQEAKV